MNEYILQSEIHSPDAWLFTATTAKVQSKQLTFTSPQEHGSTRHIVTFECKAINMGDAWLEFYHVVEKFVEGASFYTSSYLSYHDWNHIVINKTQNLALIAMFERTLGTSIGIYSQNEFDEIHKIIDESDKDTRLKHFLHCYRMAVLVDAPETQDAYEKYLILAAEALAGEVDNGSGGSKYDSKRLIQILGKDLHKYFFSHVDPVSGKTIRNANMHIGKSPNEKPMETIKIVNKLREFVKKEYGLKNIHIIKEENSPTRGYHRDDGGLIVVKGSKINDIKLSEIENLNEYFKKLPPGVDYVGGEERKEAFRRL